MSNSAISGEAEGLAGEIQLPGSGRILFGAGAMAGKLAGEVKKLGVQRALIITGNTLATKTPLLGNVSEVLGDRCAGIFSQTVQHAPRPSVLSGARAARQVAADALVVVGGSTALDTARGVALVLAEGDDLDALRARFDAAGRWIEPPSPKVAMPLLAVPTTLSGGEFSFGAGITNPATRTKESFRDRGFVPRVVILDPEMTVATDHQLWSSTALKIATDCVELICSRRHQPYSDALAAGALGLIFQYLPRSVAQPLDLAARGRLQYASLMAMSMLMVSGVGLAAALRHQIGAMWNVPHGVASSIVLPHVMAFNRSAATDRLALVARHVGVAEVDESAERAAATAISAVQQLCRKMGLPPRLRDVGALREDFEAIAEHVIGDNSVRSNPRPVATKEQVVEVLEMAY